MGRTILGMLAVLLVVGLVGAGCGDGGGDESCMPNCEGMECGGDGCGGSCGECEEPGTMCNDGVCGSGCQPHCEERECGDDGCGGTCGDCPEGGQCHDGICDRNCYPDCEGKHCGGDGCGGSCGECGPWECDAGNCVHEPECEPFCLSNDYECGEGYPGCSCGDCEEIPGGSYSCEHNQCICQPQCDGRECGDDQCGGDCGQCEEGSFCDDSGNCHIDCNWWCQGKECGHLDNGGCQCGDDGCGGACGTECHDNMCVFVACNGLECGDDGCGGSCGECPEGKACLGGSCGPDFCAWGLGMEGCCLEGALYMCMNGILDIQDCNQYDPPQTCGWAEEQYACGHEGVSPNPDLPIDCCIPECESKECGDDLCWGTCGDCQCGEECEAGACIFVNCEGKACGDDGCGGTCGDCGCGEDCQDGGCVFTACAQKTCGDDGCGGSCGDCGCGEDCQDGACVFTACDEVTCGDDGCGGNCGSCACGEDCQDGACVFTACDELACGDDGCGGTCGGCQCGEECVANACVFTACDGKTCGDDGCGGSCGLCPVCGEECQAGACAYTACEGRECGGDGCGASCGTCPDDAYCSNVSCVKKCGNNSCDYQENCQTCPQDCGQCCGDGQCQEEFQESCATCATDCGSCCGNGVCDEGEKCQDCLDDCDICAGLTWKSIPGGSFSMGCSSGDTDCHTKEYPVHGVTVAPFQMLETEVTCDQWIPVLGQVPSFGKKAATYPVEGLTWGKAKEFCEAVGGRLPTEAEFEYALRGGTTTINYCGNSPSCVDDIAWGPDNSGGKKHPVKGKAPNAYGLYDMLGNVHEWVHDCWHAEYDGAPSTAYPPWDSGCEEWWPDVPARAVRGAGYAKCNNVFGDLRSSYRFDANPLQLNEVIGFRCVR